MKKVESVWEVFVFAPMTCDLLTTPKDQTDLGKWG